MNKMKIFTTIKGAVSGKISRYQYLVVVSVVTSCDFFLVTKSMKNLFAFYIFVENEEEEKFFVWTTNVFLFSQLSQLCCSLEFSKWMKNSKIAKLSYSTRILYDVKERFTR
jgi:hypothetical protein